MCHYRSPSHRGRIAPGNQGATLDGREERAAEAGTVAANGARRPRPLSAGSGGALQRG